MRWCIGLLCFSMIALFIGCSDKDIENRVPLDQFNIDNSNNYRYIFRETIEKEHWKKSRYEKDAFKE